MENVIEYEGKKYREVKRLADVGEHVKITAVNHPRIDKYVVGDVFTVSEKDGDAVYSKDAGNPDGNSSGYISGDEYVVLEPIEDLAPEPSPQLAGIHDSLASLAVEVTKLKSVINRLTGQLTPLQLAILNAENTPSDVKLTLIVEAGRLESERQAKLDA